MRPDSDLQKLVMQSLSLDASIDETAIGVSVRHGIVTLTGFVGSYAEAHAAEAVAHRVPGVLDVANDLDIARRSASNPTDPEIAEAARNALASNPMIPHERIQTTVAGHGHVTLTGSVQTLREHEAAEAAVRHLQGVGLVTNQIVIEPPATSSLQLRGAIEAALEGQSRAVAQIGVEVDGETVVLTGTVDSQAERRTVVGVVKAAPGIKHVDDRLHIATPSLAGNAAT
jgi:osmotically-inducible protein OsmY